MRLPLTLMAALLATTAQADEFLLRADVTAATIFLSGMSEIERQVSVQVPAGAHEVLLALPHRFDLELPDVSGTGDARIGALTVIRDYRIEEGALDSDEVAAARAQIDGFEEDAEALREDITGADAAVQAAALQRRYLEGVTAGGDNAAPFPSDPELLGQMLAALGVEMARVSEEARQAALRQRELRENLDEVMADMAAAQADLEALYPFGEMATVVRVPIMAEAETELNLMLSHLAFNTNWTPQYRVDLNSEAETLVVSRDILISLADREVWRDVALSVSTADPDRRRQPGIVRSRPARINEPTLTRAGAGFATLSDGAPMAEAGAIAPLLEPMVITETAAMQAVGASFTFSFPDPVTVTPGARNVQAMAALEFEVDLFNQANPRNDDTAYLMAALENDSGEPILRGEAVFYRDGEILGGGYLDDLADGASTDLAFGALDHLLLEWSNLSLDEGQSGVFTRSDTQGRSVEFSVENTSDETEEVRVLYALPFAEQEDLEVDLDLSLRPDARDVDGARGVAAWDLVLEPGARQVIRMDAEFSWPEGQVLNWVP
jgi:uncharacterized protein (TIGR02231 family)